MRIPLNWLNDYLTPPLADTDAIAIRFDVTFAFAAVTSDWAEVTAIAAV